MTGGIKIISNSTITPEDPVGTIETDSRLSRSYAWAEDASEAEVNRFQPLSLVLRSAKSFTSRKILFFVV